MLATGGMGLISVAKPMIGDIFTKSMPHLVTASFASAYLMAMAAGNLGGRIGWAGKLHLNKPLAPNVFLTSLYTKGINTLQKAMPH